MTLRRTNLVLGNLCEPELTLKHNVTFPPQNKTGHGMLGLARHARKA
jgi:hypothetical protein